MKKLTHRLAPPLSCLLVVAAAGAQNLNPDISVIGDVRAWVTDSASDARERELQLDLESVELALQGYLNPFARADVYVGYHDDEFELEEAYVTILRGLPAGIQARAGKYRVDFGKLNLLHPHAYSFLDTPLAHRQYLGHEGLVDTGLNVNWQAPVGGAVLTLSANVLKGDFAVPHDHGEGGDAHLHAVAAPGFTPATLDEEEEASEASEPEPDLGYSERASVFIPTGDYAGVEIGVSALQGTLDAATGRNVSLLGADLKYRWAPDRYRSLTLQAEWLRSRRDAVPHDHEGAAAAAEAPAPETVEAAGFFAFADWRFRQRWNAGAIVERAELAEEDGVATDRIGLFGGFQLMEETTFLRLLVRRSDGDEIDRPFSEAILQLVFSLGPHRAHWF